MVFFSHTWVECIFFFFSYNVRIINVSPSDEAEMNWKHGYIQKDYGIPCYYSIGYTYFSAYIRIYSSLVGNLLHSQEKPAASQWSGIYFWMLMCLEWKYYCFSFSLFLFLPAPHRGNRASICIIPNCKRAAGDHTDSYRIHTKNNVVQQRGKEGQYQGGSPPPRNGSIRPWLFLLIL